MPSPGARWSVHMRAGRRPYGGAKPPDDWPLRTTARAVHNLVLVLLR